MSQGTFLYKNNDFYSNNFNEIIPNERKDKCFDVEEVEVYKILII